jgi:hypothetical protein
MKVIWLDWCGRSRATKVLSGARSGKEVCVAVPTTKDAVRLGDRILREAGVSNDNALSDPSSEG